MPMPEWRMHSCLLHNFYFQIGPPLSLPQFKVCQGKFKLYGVNCLNKAMVFHVDAPQGVKNLNNLSSPSFSKRDAIIMF